MPRIAFRLWLRPDPTGIDTYVRGHLDPFPELYERIRAVGIRRYTIWLDKADLLLTREGETPWVGETLDLTDPVQQAWVDTMRPLFIERVAQEGATRPEEVFALDPDAAPGRERMTYRAGLRPGREAEAAVTAAHANVPGGVADALRAAGIRRQWSWVEDGDLWAYLECDDVQAVEDRLAGSSAHREWWASLETHLDEGTRVEGRRRTREVFRCD